MLRSLLPDADRIDARTPADRDRYVDLLRLSSILLVVLGHWLVGVVEVRDGAVEVGRLIAIVPETQPLTWVFQVMPLFFLVGGAVNAGSWERAREAGTVWTVWLRRRARRLLGPLVALLALWLPLTVVLQLLDVPEGWVAEAIDNALLPVWFLAVYLLAIALVPLTWRLHRAAGVWVLVVMVALTGVIDQLHRAEVPAVGFANYLLVWAGAHQVGYLWYDRRLPTAPGPAAAVALGGAAAMTALLTVGGYPVAMVAPGGGWPDNSDPPSLAMWALLVTQLGIVLTLRRPVERWLSRPRVWAPVVLGGSVTMTVFLWHMTALVLVAAATHPTGLWPETATIDGTWWALRPLWIGLCTLALIGLVAVFRRFEEVADPVPREGRLRALIGLAATVTGIGLIMTGGVYEPDRTGGLPLGALGLLAIGLGQLGVLNPRPDAARDDASDDDSDTASAADADDRADAGAEADGR
jgi:peptidoglycan/LPS O-acetylase OafA/YrhL